MGNEQPKKIPRVAKAQIDVGALKARIHLELVRDRKNNEIIKGEKDLVAKIRKQSRNKTEEILIAERVINGLKYAQACQLLASYAATLRMQAHFISQNMNNPQKMEPYLQMIYSLIYAADHMGLSSLVEFKNLMRALNDPVAVEKYVNPDIMKALIPSPTPEELNIYFCEMSERNEIPLEEINIPGHRFTKDWKGGPNVPPGPPGSNFSDLERMLGEDLKNRFNSPGGFGGFGGGGTGNNFNPYHQMDAKNLIGHNGVTPPNNVPNNNQFVGGNGPGMGTGNRGNSYPNTPANLGPNFYVPPEIAAKEKGQVKQSITSINDIDYYPQMDANPALFKKGDIKDPDFDSICERLRKGL